MAGITMTDICDAEAQMQKAADRIDALKDLESPGRPQYIAEALDELRQGRGRLSDIACQLLRERARKVPGTVPSSRLNLD